MASPAKNNTLSPSIPSRPNPKPRNSESGDPMRRSFRGSPFPTDPSRRNSIGNDKENQIERDHQISNVVVKAPKGATKNFMSPTISAVSKINPSPRKKILSDKNEVSRSFDKSTHHHHPVRSSVSFSDVISIIGDDKEQISIDENKEDSHDVTVTDFGESNGEVVDDLGSKSSPLPYAFPSQQVDPLVAPYDPKKNYLSPRPQFLHYRPNPRIERHFDECKQLEDLFISSSSETDLSAEESQQEEEVVSKEEEVVPLETELDKGEEIDVEEEETLQVTRHSRFKISRFIAWLLALGVAYLLLLSSVAFTQPSMIQDSPFYKFHVPPEITKSARESFEELSVKLGIWAESSLVYLDKFISALGEEEGYGSFQYHNLTDMIQDTRSSDTVFQTPSAEISAAGLLVDSQDWNLELDIEEENEEAENGDETNLEAVYEEDGNGFEQEGEGGDVNSEMLTLFDKQTEISMATDTEVNGGERYSESLSEEGQIEYEENVQRAISVQNDEKNLEEAESYVHQLDDVESSAITGHLQEETQVANAETESDAHQHDVASSQFSGYQQEETQVANAETVPQEEGVGEVAGNSFDVSTETTNVDGNDLEEESELGEVVNDAGAGSEEMMLRSNQKQVVVLFSTVMVLLVAAATGFVLAKKKAKPVVPTAIADTKEVEHVPVEKLIKETLSSLNFQEEQEVGDDRKREVSSLPSEMSFSFHNRSLHSCNNRDDLKENQSGGGGRKSNDSGESMASSASEYSIGSVSYGSFTTYEKIQKRSSRTEEDIMVTPVRRSSRIRNHQNSGQ